MSSPSDNDDEKKLEIEYPTSWGYRIIGSDEAALRAAAETVMRHMDFQINAGHESSGGSYVSLHIKAVIWSEEQRLEKFWALANHDAVKFVI